MNHKDASPSSTYCAKVYNNVSTSPRQKRTVTKLIGNECLVKIDKVYTIALLDTCAQLSLLPAKWLEEHLPHLEVRELNEVLDHSLTVKAAK